MGPQSCKNPSCGNSRTPTWESQDKMPFDGGLMESHRVYYKGEGGGFPQVQVVVNLVNLNLLVLRLSTKSAQTMH